MPGVIGLDELLTLSVFSWSLFYVDDQLMTRSHVQQNLGLVRETNLAGCVSFRIS